MENIVFYITTTPKEFTRECVMSAIDDAVGKIWEYARKTFRVRNYDMAQMVQ